MGKPGPIKKAKQQQNTSKVMPSVTNNSSQKHRNPEQYEVSNGDHAMDTSATNRDTEASADAEVDLSSVEDLTISEDGASRLRPPRSLERTLFERLEVFYGSGIKRVLTTQYR
jgi:DNA polymerase alpha-associated DNA helicase A